MLTAEIKVNGCLIAHVYIVNRSTRSLLPIGIPDKPNTYDYEIFDAAFDNRSVSRGKVTHDRIDGALVLLHKVLSKYTKRYAKHS